MFRLLQLFDENLVFLALWTMAPPSLSPSKLTPASQLLLASTSSQMSPYGLAFASSHPILPLQSSVIVAYTNDDSSTGTLRAYMLHA
jgi:hypothetical protein